MGSLNMLTCCVPQRTWVLLVRISSCSPNTGFLLAVVQVKLHINVSPPPQFKASTCYHTCNHFMFFASKLFCIPSQSQRPASASQGSGQSSTSTFKCWHAFELKTPGLSALCSLPLVFPAPSSAAQRTSDFTDGVSIFVCVSQTRPSALLCSVELRLWHCKTKVWQRKESVKNKESVAGSTSNCPVYMESLNAFADWL